MAVDENLGFKSIADRLNEAGFRAKSGQPFASYTIQRILLNEALMGTLTYGKRPRKGNPKPEIVEVPDFFPPILSQEEWARLQERLAIRRELSRGGTHTSVYLLSGIVRCGNCRGPMVGKVAARRKSGGRYRNYWCQWAMASRAKCSTYNGHSAPKLEKAILDYLGQFSDPALVREHLEAAERTQIKKKDKELQEVTKGLKDLDSQFLKHLDLLNRSVINEAEFTRANELIRSQKPALEASKRDLETWVEQQQAKLSTAERMPEAIRAFIEDFQELEPRIQKAHLQMILKAAYVYRDNRIELEFRQ